MATSSASTTPMKYRFLGDSGLLVSQIGIGSWVTFADTATVDKAYDIMAHGYKNGINFWDSAEGYGSGAAEEVLGQVFHRGAENKI
ncbi:hypothetical protein Poli38472_007023 [Pythium oligandrum]|uniref:NADP-dependent oxidoreductase domain-containing protein n=1 Tax=Pythium oligandrum TaxID=41045 RepID=A0A8K1C9G4_PYTOL|nr:hypothetical protein Poli38472_007023 [Pythium oligandrum]|eukprot:TMW58878.1 hypothetical protein Poli38472_007023 [Pythium oligandrum]